MAEFIEKYIADMLLSFYGDGDNDFYEYLDDDVMWYGPLEGQTIKGRDELKKVLYGGSRSLRFHIDNMKTKLFPLRADVILIIAEYRLTACYRNGKVVNYDQHAMVVIRKRRLEDGQQVWRCPLIHISDILYKEKRDSSYALLIDEEKKQRLDRIIDERGQTEKIILSGEGNSSYFLGADSIRYIEGGKGIRSYVYTQEGMYTVTHLLKDIEKKLPDCYYRCHASYIVNMNCIKKISGYKITLDDGTEIPVPVKKYSAVREYIVAYAGGNAQ
ncbi:MAG: LytTR family transcriptional regulator DNA-binding domain-containing protein [Clostridia bacterium]|nr:LytTR family transcriptional regulator DNA-binding domain-containing protein [Clostridia bacterium]